MAILDALVLAVEKNTSVDESAKQAIAGLTAKIQELIDASAGSVDTAALQQLVDQINTSSDALAAAIPAGTTPTP